jgi:pimeloyl-ACP methyl ester carboxylesterase
MPVFIGAGHRVVVPEARHFLQEDIPEAYNRALTDWLRDQF